MALVSRDTEPLALLARLKAALQGAYAVPDEISSILLAEIGRYEAGEVSDVCLGQIFGLRKPGARTLKTILDQQRADLLLSIAYGCAAGKDFHAGPKERCEYLVTSIRRLDRVWDRLPQTVTSWEKEMFVRLAEIKKMELAGGPRLPRTWEGIRAALRRRR